MPLAPFDAAMILLAVRDRRGDRLFEEDVLAGLQRGDRRLGVLVPHGADRDRVDVGIGEQVVVVAIESSSRRTSRPCAASRSGVRVQSAASSRLGTPTMVSQWISPNQPSPITPMRSLSMTCLPQKSSSVSSRAMTMLPAVSPQSTGSATPVIGAGGVGGEEGDDARHLVRLDDAAERIPALERLQHVRVLGLALVPDRRAHRARQHELARMP